MAENGVANDEPLENEIQQRLKRFQDLNRFKRQALKLIASYMSPEEVSGLRNQFHSLDRDQSGARCCWVGIVMRTACMHGTTFSGLCGFSFARVCPGVVARTAGPRTASASN